MNRIARFLIRQSILRAFRRMNPTPAQVIANQLNVIFRERSP